MYFASFFAKIVKKMPKNIVVSRKNAIFAVDLPITAIGDAGNMETRKGGSANLICLINK